MFSEAQAKLDSASALGQPCSGRHYAATPDAVLCGAGGISHVFKWERSMRRSLES